MKTLLHILIGLSFFSCASDNGHDKVEKLHEVEEMEEEIWLPEESDEPAKGEFDINKFRRGSDSLLKALKGERYFFELKTEVFNFMTDNPEIFMRGHGFFWPLYQDPSEKIVRHYLYVPDTKKQLRIYLVEAEYRNREQLETVISKLENSMKDSLPANDSDDYIKLGLSPVNDYIMASGTKLLWLNASYPYSNREFLKFINCLKNNVDTGIYKGRIICLFGKPCENGNVP